jgi:hypothetical protein
MPYLPVEVCEDAVADYYASSVWLPAETRDQVRARIDEALSDTFGITDQMREDSGKELAALDRKESYFLDLAAEEGWPKDRLREKIDAIRASRAQVRRSLDRTAHQLDTGKEIFYQALDMLDSPGAMYRRGGENVRSILNKTFFTRLYVDGRRITSAELKEPFSVLQEAYHLYQSHSKARMTAVKPDEVIKGDTILTDRTEYDTLSMMSLLAMVLADHGSSNQFMVGLAGFEPAASATQTRRASQAALQPVYELSVAVAPHRPVRHPLLGRRIRRFLVPLGRGRHPLTGGRTRSRRAAR